MTDPAAPQPLLVNTDHRPLLVYFDPEKIPIPAEVCETCSDDVTGHWVPVTSCPVSAANQLPEGAPCENVLVLPPCCPACGRRDLMDAWADRSAGTGGWRCLYPECGHITTDGETP